MDSNVNKIEVTDVKKPFEFYIPRANGFKAPPFELVQNQTDNILKLRGISQITKFLSLHIQILPEKLTIGYLFVLKKNADPVLNDQVIDYDYAKLFCGEG